VDTECSVEAIERGPVLNLLKEAEIECPYCGERITLLVDCSVGSQEYIEDCQVCCRPINLYLTVDEDGPPQVEVRREDE
jgi:DNA-directed RNA polymerase subunit RPC12/RpoP